MGKKNPNTALTGKYNPYYWLCLQLVWGRCWRKEGELFPVGCCHAVRDNSCQPHPSDPTTCPGKAAPALCSFPLILSLLYQIPQDFLPLWNIWGSVATTAMKLIPASSAQALDVTLVPSCQHCPCSLSMHSMVYAHWYSQGVTDTSATFQQHLTSVSFTLRPPPQKLTSNSFSITSWLLISLPPTLV